MIHRVDVDSGRPRYRIRRSGVQAGLIIVEGGEEARRQFVDQRLPSWAPSSPSIDEVKCTVVGELGGGYRERMRPVGVYVDGWRETG